MRTFFQLALLILSSILVSCSTLENSFEQSSKFDKQSAQYRKSKLNDDTWINRINDIR